MEPDLSGKTVAVVGAGRSGVAAARFLAAAGARVRLTDAGRPELPRLPGVELFLGGHPEACFAGVDEVVLSPGVPRRHPVVQGLLARGVPVVGEVELAFRHSRRPWLAVTGTNGKSTTVAWLHAILEGAGEAAVLGGNIGTPAVEVACDGATGPCVVELSSFQLESIATLRPRVAVLLNVTPDHEDRYPDFDAYRAAKLRIFENQGPGDTGIVCRDDPALAEAAAGRLGFALAPRPGAQAWVEGGWVRVETERFCGRLLPAAEIALPGRHNQANALAAALAALAWGVTPEAVAAGLARFRGLPHRGEVVAEAAGVRYVDNSKATNVGAVAAVLAGYGPGEVVLVAGGSSKGADFAPLRGPVARACDRVLLIGETAPALAAALAGCCPVEVAETLERAVARAREVARPGQTVLLAPACASFDQFTGYAHRGRRFAELAAAGGRRPPAE
ncbi:MAG: UDP-N-acetylmuramoyl-L-alanine--D-glutamate ligase [Nitrospirae bacterium]|nr:MAG: UDP-N-acetylmuramoyl-L-alanine--D-glutamate ligase [Nitrospirota bacterium]